MKYLKFLLLIVTVIPYPVLAQDKSTYLDGPINLLADHDGASILENMGHVNEALYEILALTYQNNPTIRSARLEVLIEQENVRQAKSAYLPTVSADADITYSNTESEGNDFISSDGGNLAKSASLNLNQPLYAGGATQAYITQTQYNLTSKQFYLSGVEQQTLYEAVVVYMDLYTNQAVLDLQFNNKSLVAKELEQAQARFEVGEITRTDVSQSEARLAQAQAGVISAQAAVKTALASFQQVVGNPPSVNMGYPAIRFEIPSALEEAVKLALTNNREILQAKLNKAAARSGIRISQAGLLPTVSATGRLNQSYTPSDFVDEQSKASFGVSASIPLYTGGATQSRIRQAKKLTQQRSEQIIETEQRVEQQLVESWENWEAAKATTQARLSQVEASAIAQEGVHYETEFGERTTLDALNANQELLSAQVELIKSKRNEIVAGFAISQNLGLLVPQNLGFSTINP